MAITLKIVFFAVVLVTAFFVATSTSVPLSDGATKSLKVTIKLVHQNLIGKIVVMSNLYFLRQASATLSLANLLSVSKVDTSQWKNFVAPLCSVSATTDYTFAHYAADGMSGEVCAYGNMFWQTTAPATGDFISMWYDVDKIFNTSNLRFSRNDTKYDAKTYPFWPMIQAAQPAVWPFWLSSSGEVGITMAIPFVDGNTGAYAGYAAGISHTGALNELLKEFNVGLTGKMLLVHTTTRDVIASNFKYVKFGKTGSVTRITKLSEIAEPLIKTALDMVGIETVFTAVSPYHPENPLEVPGDKLLLNVVQIDTIPGLVLRLVQVIPASDFSTDMAVGSQISMAMGVVVGVGFAALSFVIAMVLLKPLTALTDVMATGATEPAADAAPAPVAEVLMAQRAFATVQDMLKHTKITVAESEMSPAEGRVADAV
jgi:hypothetical protein